MATKTSIIIKSTDENGKATSRSVTDVSSKATNAQLQAFAEALNDTSINTYQSSSKVQTTDLDGATDKAARTVLLKQQGEQGAGHYTTITSAIHPNTLGAFSTESNEQTFLFDYTGDSADTYLILDKDFPFEVLITPPYVDGSNVMTIALADDSSTVNASVTSYATIGVAETDNYKAGEFVVTIKGGNS